MKKIMFLAVGLLMAGAGCAGGGSAPTSTGNATSTTFTYLATTEPGGSSTKYCNGADMDSAGFRRTLTVEKTATTAADLSQPLNRVKAVLHAATANMCQTVIDQSNLRLENGKLIIPQIDAWAGVSITMCSCKPIVEVNAVRVPGVTSVVWE